MDPRTHGARFVRARRRAVPGASLHRRTPLPVSAAVIAALLVGACGSGGSTEIVAGQGTTTETLGQTTTTDASGSTTTAEPSSTTTVPESTTTVTSVSTSTTGVVEVDLTEYGLSEDELACVVDHLPDGVAAEHAPKPAADDALASCGRLAAFGEDFLAGLRDAHPGLSEGEYGCLVEAYGALSAAEAQTLLTAALDPSSGAAAEAAEIGSAMFEGCGVDV